MKVSYWGNVLINCIREGEGGGGAHVGLMKMYKFQSEQSLHMDASFHLQYLQISPSEKVKHKKESEYVELRIRFSPQRIRIRPKLEKLELGLSHNQNIKDPVSTGSGSSFLRESSKH